MIMCVVMGNCIYQLLNIIERFPLEIDVQGNRFDYCDEF